MSNEQEQELRGLAEQMVLMAPEGVQAVIFLTSPNGRAAAIQEFTSVSELAEMVGWHAKFVLMAAADGDLAESMKSAGIVHRSLRTDDDEG